MVRPGLFSRFEGAFPIYGLAGLLIILIAEILMFRGVEPVATWFTPIVWTGYILFADALVLRRRGHSLLHDRPREFAMMIPLSVGIWLIFEVYNLHLKNWHYIGVPPPPWRYIGFFWSFATILPGVLETTHLLGPPGPASQSQAKGRAILPVLLVSMMMVGFILLIVPLLLPYEVARYFFGMVWLGFILLMEPVNHRLGVPSLLRDWVRGDFRKTRDLLLAGLICGFLWEFWNFWAHGKWVYDVPLLSQIKIFEMPILGFIGFPPFALELYSMYNFLKYWLNRLGARI